MKNVEEFAAFAKTYYHPQAKQFQIVQLPKMRYLMLEGKGNPDQQDFSSMIRWLYGVVHTSKPVAKKIMGKDFGYPPIEFQFWAKNKKDFFVGNKDKWLWRVMVLCADFMPKKVIDDAIVEVNDKLGNPAGNIKLTHLTEGKCVQYLHVGAYSTIAKVCEKLYGDFLPTNKLTPNGYYHEIYLNDPTRAAPSKRKIIIRQPVK